MQINLLKKVAENAAGEQAVKIVDLLYGKKDVNEFLIAKKLNLTINQTRNLLYRLSHLGIISSIRKKDKRKGWYIYFWTFNVLKSLEVLEQSISDEISSLQNELNSKKQKRFYKCQFCGRESNEETALLSNFTCPECGEVYGLMDNAPLLAEVSKKIEKLFRERESIRNEIKKEQDLINAKLGRQMKREEKKKKELRRKAFEERKKLKQKNKKSSFKDKKNKKKL
jgi:transcription factor E